MRYFLILTCLLCILTCVSAAMAGPIADSIAFQGRLTDLSDNPVPDGPRDLIISLWSDSVGGTMLHSEIVVVSVSNGLYSTCIGCGSSSFFDIFTDQPLFLQTQLAGQSPMTPRTRLRNTPRALVSSRVRGDVATAPGMMVVGDSTTGGFARVHAGLQATGSALSQGAALSGRSLITNDCDDTDASAYFGHSQGSNVGVISLRSTADSTDVSISQSDPSGESGMSMKGKNIRKNISVTLFRRESSSSHSVGLSADTGSSSMMLDCDDDGDGIAESSVSSSCDASSSSQVQEKKGINAVNVKLARTISSPPGGPVAVDALDMDSDDDGVMDVSSIDSIDATGARRRLSTHNLGSSGQDGVDVQLSAQKEGGFVKVTASQNSQSLRCSGSADSVAATLNVDSDHDGDGTPECRAEATVSDKFAQVRGFKVEITGRSSGFGSVCDSSGASSSLTLDVDGDGHTETDFDASVSDSHSVCRVAVGRILQNLANETAPSEKSAVFIASGDIDDDGISNTDVMMKVTPTVAMHAINTKGTGAQGGRVVSITSGTTVDSATISVVHDDGLAGSAAVEITSSGIDSYIHLTEDGLTVLKLSSSSSNHPIEHSSGAHLTPGGVWTNASDENLKENFQPVNGAALLEKIDQLPISEWNYKTESDDVTHIGPTAQDFQKVFGVGENDKTISTIDPSGIALAAIKELNMQNQQLQAQSKELREQNEQLRRELNDLKVLIEKVTSRK